MQLLSPTERRPGPHAVRLVESTTASARQRLVTLADSAPLIEAARLLGEAGGDIVVVCGPDGRLGGVVTKTDVVRLIAHCEGSSCKIAAAAVMTRDTLSCQSDDRLQDIWSKMNARGLKNVPIIDRDSRPVGVLNARDALEGLLQDVENEESLLRDYVMGVGYR